MALGPRVMALHPSTALIKKAISTKERGYPHTECTVTAFYFALQH